MLSKTGHSKSKLLAVFNHWENTGVITVNTGAGRGFAHPNHPRYVAPFSHEAQKAVCGEIDRMVDQGETVTSSKLQTFIADITGRLLSHRTINYYWFQRWKCGWGKIKEMTVMDPVWHKQRIATFIAKYWLALKLVAAGTHVMCWMDETYVWQNCARFFSWFTRSRKRNRKMKQTRRSHRLIVLHSMHRKGLLWKERRPTDDDLRIPAKNAEYIYTINTRKKKEASANNNTNTSNSNTRDQQATDKDEYHDNVTAKIWLKWLTDKFLPAFFAEFPDKKPILIMDNAKYHNAHQEGYIAISKMNRSQLIDALAKLNITSFTAQRKISDGNGGHSLVNHLFHINDWHGTTRGSVYSNVPVNDELAQGLRDYYKQNPQAIMTETAKIMQRVGGIVIWTPPFVPECQPIEMLWGIVKGKVADMYKLGRTIDETRAQLLQALYDVPAETFESMVKNCEKWMNEWIATEGKDWLQGTLDGDLKWDATKLPHTQLEMGVAQGTDPDEDDEEDEDSDNASVERERQLQEQEDDDQMSDHTIQIITLRSEQSTVSDSASMDLTT